MPETMVRMGELAASAVAGDVLVSLGLGSCIGLALVDRRAGIAGLAHVVLPSSGGHAAPGSFKFADKAVPELIDRVVAEGARKQMLDAVLVGGASMFTVSSASLEVGQRNEAAVRDQLSAARIPIVATETGGDRGRTIRVFVGARKVTVREAGGADRVLAEAVAGAALSSARTRSRPLWTRPVRAGCPRRRPPRSAAGACARSTSRARRSSPPSRRDGCTARWTPSAAPRRRG